MVGIKSWDENVLGGLGSLPPWVCLCSLNIFVKCETCYCPDMASAIVSKKSNKQNKTWLIQHELNWLQIRLELCHEKNGFLWI